MRTGGHIFRLKCFSAILLSVFPCKAQNQTYQFITLDATSYNAFNYGPDLGPLANYVPADQTLISPSYLTVDAAGNVYFGEEADIRKVTAESVVAPVAGFIGNTSTYYCCGGGDGGPALLAGVSPGPPTPGGMGFDPCGYLWFSDSRPATRRISPSGVINTIASFGGYLAVDSNCNAYVAAQAIEKISSNGTIAEYPNTATLVGSHGLTAIAADSSGDVYAANGLLNIVQKITPSGAISTFAGSGTAGYSGDGGAATSAEVANPCCIATDAAGNIYFADSVRGIVRKVSAGGVITTVAGGGNTFGEGGPATQAILKNPLALTTDSSGNLYIAESSSYTTSPISDFFGGRIRKVTPDGNIHTIAGLLLAGCCGDGGSLSQAYFTQTWGIAQDAQGNVYVADPGQHKVRKFAPDLTITTVAGTGVPGFAGDGAPATQALLNSPHSVAVDNFGNLYIADSGNNRIRMVSAAGNIQTFAGNGLPTFAGDGGPAAKASLSTPNFVLLDHSGNLFIADTGAHRIRKVTPDGIIHTFAGNGTVGFGGDGGPATAAQLSTPQSLAIDASGNLYIADNPVNTIRKINPEGIITTFAGIPGKQGNGGDGGPANQALLNVPFGVATDAAGNVWIADTGNSTIRVVTPDGRINTVSNTAAVALAPDTNGNMYVASNVLQGRLGYLYTGALSFPLFAPFVPWIRIQNASGASGGAVAPGMITAIYGGNLGPQQGVIAAPDSTGTYGNSLGGVQVFFNDVAAPILYAQASQINVVVPFEVAGMNTVNIHVEYNGTSSNTNTLPVTPAFPGIFEVLNPDGTQNGSIPGEPAMQGSVLDVLATGGGQTNPSGIDGAFITAPVPILLAQVQASIQYPTGPHQTAVVSAPVVYAGPALHYLAGVLEVSVQIPPLPGFVQQSSGPATILTIAVDGADASTPVVVQ